MECNRDEAVRARDIADQKFAKQDFLGAKKFLLKAQQLFPTLEGLNHMMPVMEVHSVAQCKVGSNETDWYGILQVEPNADDNTVKKQYRRLALLLHPDKNKSVGAEAAFKLISEAWGILSDKTKRAVHNMRRGVKPKAPHSRVAMESNMQSFQTPFNAAAPAPAPAPAPTPHPPHPPPHPPHAPHHTNGAFWTSCPSCKMQYQYLRTYENYQLQCPKCKEFFVARDIHSTAADGGGTGYGWPPFEGQRQDFNFNKPPATAGFNGASTPNGFMNGSFNVPFPNQASGGPFFSPAATAAAGQSKVAAAAAAAAAAASANNLAANVVQQTYQKVKRERVEAEKEVKRVEKETRRKEKEDQRKEREEQRKAREAERSRDAMDRLVAKRKENVAKEEFKRNVDGRTSRKLKRKRRNSSPEDAEELEDEESFEQGLQDDLSSTPTARRRSARNKTNVASYKVDVSDDSELEEFPASRRTKVEVEGNADNTEKSEENGREPDTQQARRENGGKGKSIADDTHHEKRGSVDSGMNGTEELVGERRRRPGTERHKDDPVGVSEKESNDSVFVETSRRFEGVARESKVHEESPRDALRTKSGKTSQQGELPPAEKGMDCGANQEGGNMLKSEEFRDEKSPSKSPRTLRMRVKSPKVPYSSQFEEIRQLHRRASPTISAGTKFSSDREDEEEDGDSEFNIAVPDPDFHDFDSFRTEQHIIPGQIWAIYDDLDGMPRFYGRISRVTHKPFRAHLSWLEQSSTSDKSKSSAGLSCGEYKVGKVTVLSQINTFSHVVMDKVGKGMVKVYPKAHQVWALFRDWDPDQSSAAGGPGGEDPHSYDMVEILGDFTEEKGVKTMKLVKVKGYKTLFQRQDGHDPVRIYKPSDLGKFSHSVPVQRMLDREADQYGIPRGSLELDPASTPLELIVDQSDRSS